MQSISLGEIAKGMRVAVTLKSGRRVAGVATRKIHGERGYGFTLRIRRFNGQAEVVSSWDIARSAGGAVQVNTF